LAQVGSKAATTLQLLCSASRLPHAAPTVTRRSACKNAFQGRMVAAHIFPRAAAMPERMGPGKAGPLFSRSGGSNDSTSAQPEGLGINQNAASADEMKREDGSLKRAVAFFDKLTQENNMCQPSSSLDHCIIDRSNQTSGHDNFKLQHPSSGSTFLAPVGQTPGNSRFDDASVEDGSEETLSSGPPSENGSAAALQASTVPECIDDKKSKLLSSDGHTRHTHDSVAEIVEKQASNCFHLRHVLVDKLLDDGTLGLLLENTRIVGFCDGNVERFGWRLGDQIVEVGGLHVGSFEEFIDEFVAAQAENGLPIDFSVLRREDGSNEGASENVTGTLDSFFNGLNFKDLAGKLRQLRGPDSRRESSLRGGHGALQAPLVRTESITDNPYVQALRRRRVELTKTTEGWQSGMNEPDSLASQLATQRDGIATLMGPGSEGGVVAAGAPRQVAAKQPGGCGWLVGPVRGQPESCSVDVVPSPRVDAQETFDRHNCHRQVAYKDDAGTSKEYLSGRGMSTTSKILESPRVAPPGTDPSNKVSLNFASVFLKK